MIHLFLGQDGTIWFDEGGDSREVSRLYEHDTEREFVANAIANATNDYSGLFVVLSLKDGSEIQKGAFSQSREGVKIYQL